MSEPVPALLVAGDPRHGVVLHAGQVANAVQAACPAARIVTEPPVAGALHLHFTDRLWGATPELAADRVCELAPGRRLTVTLHDVPQASDGTGMIRRRDAYRRVAAASAGVVVSSAHERRLLARHATVPDGRPVEVIPLAVMAADAIGDADPRAPDDTVSLLGYVYPGKGHAAAIDAVAGLPAPRPAVRALGAVSRGHEDELTSLRARARARDVDFEATGWLDDAELLARARAARVPLAAHDHVSASGSINLWIAAGRVPLVVDSPYARELERLRPGTIRRYGPPDLRDAIAVALTDDAGTRLASGIDTRPHLDEVAAAYLRWWSRS